MKPGSKRIISILGLLLAAGCLFAFFRKIEWQPLWRCLNEAKWRYVWLATAFTLIGMMLRALRWEVLLRPMKKVPIRDVTSITFIGFMANTVLPARAGEIIKPLALSHKEKMPFAGCLGTVVVERILDLLATAILGIVVLLSLSQIVDTDAKYFVQLERIARAGGVLAMAGLVGMLLFVIFPTQAHGIAHRMTAILPAHWQARIMGVFESFEKGFHGLRSVRQAATASALTAALWINYTAVYYVLGFALGIPMTVLSACFIIVVLCAAVAVPQAPGFLGVFQLVAKWACCGVLGAEETAANTYAMLSWAVCFLPIVAGGVICLWMEGVSLRQLKREAEAEGSPPAADHRL